MRRRGWRELMTAIQSGVLVHDPHCERRASIIECDLLVTSRPRRADETQRTGCEMPCLNAVHTGGTEDRLPPSTVVVH